MYSVDGTIFSPTRLPKHRDYVGSLIISSLNCLHRRDNWEQSYSTATGPSDDIDKSILILMIILTRARLHKHSNHTGN